MVVRPFLNNFVCTFGSFLGCLVMSACYEKDHVLKVCLVVSGHINILLVLAVYPVVTQNLLNTSGRKGVMMIGKCVCGGWIMKIFGHFKRHPRTSFKEKVFLTVLWLHSLFCTGLGCFLLCAEVLVKYWDLKVLR